MNRCLTCCLIFVFSVSCSNRGTRGLTFPDQNDEIENKGKITVFVRENDDAEASAKALYQCAIRFDASGRSPVNDVTIRLSSVTTPAGKVILHPSQSRGALTPSFSGGGGYFVHSVPDVLLKKEALIFNFEVELDSENQAFQMTLDPG